MCDLDSEKNCFPVLLDLNACLISSCGGVSLFISLEQVSILSLLWRRQCFSKMCIWFRRMPLRLKSARSCWCFCRIYYKNRAFLGVWIKQWGRILRYCSVRKWYIICYVKKLMNFSDQQDFWKTLPSPEQLTDRNLF